MNNRAGLSSIGPNTTIYGEEYMVENGEIEELHYLMVRVEKMKKTMLGKVESRYDPNQNKDKSGNFINMIDEKEEALYRIGEIAPRVNNDINILATGDETNPNSMIEH